MRIHLSVLLVAAAALIGCGSIEKSASVQQPLGKSLLAGPGDVVLRIDRERSLANIHGKADIWGRKTNEGFTEIRFAGVEPDGQVVLYRKDIEILSNETTLTRTPLSFTSGSATTSATGTAYSSGSSTQFSGVARSSGTATTVNSGTAYHMAIPADTVAIRLAPGERRLPISGYFIEVLAATPNSIEFRVHSNTAK